MHPAPTRMLCGSTHIGWLQAWVMGGNVIQFFGKLERTGRESVRWDFVTPRPPEQDIAYLVETGSRFRIHIPMPEMRSEFPEVR